MRRLARLAALLAVSAPLGAQVAVHATAEAGLTSPYLWRGIRRATGWNAQADYNLLLEAGRARLTVGAWANAELSAHRDPSLTDRPDGDPGLSEWNVWAEAAHPVGRVDLAAGVIRYEYRGRLGRSGTTEVYARARRTFGRAHPIGTEAALWVDIDRRRSGYFEARTTVPVIALPFLGPALLLYTAAEAGLAIGHADGTPALAATRFAGSGLAHAAVSAGLRARFDLTIADLVFVAAERLEYRGDPATRRRSIRPGDLGPHLKPLGTLSLGLAWPHRKPQ